MFMIIGGNIAGAVAKRWLPSEAKSPALAVHAGTYRRHRTYFLNVEFQYARLHIIGLIDELRPVYLFYYVASIIRGAEITVYYMSCFFFFT